VSDAQAGAPEASGSAPVYKPPPRGASGGRVGGGTRGSGGETLVSGIHGIRLADHGLRLVRGVRYHWSVAVIIDTERRSRDVVAARLIETGMRAVKVVAVISLLALVSGIPISRAGSEERQTQPQQGSQSAQKKEAPAQTAVTVPTYRPPLRGAPGGRVGGGTRGTGRETFVLSVLAPDHTGLTVSEQPSLYWFISSPSTFPVEVTVVDPRATQPIFETRIPPPVQAGAHRIRLADHGVRLTPGIAYRWYVAVVPDSGRRSKDILAGGAMERVALPESLGAKLSQADKATVPFLYAEAGIWYDALAALSELIEAAPNDPALLRQRAALMAQVGLPEIGE